MRTALAFMLVATLTAASASAEETADYVKGRKDNAIMLEVLRGGGAIGYWRKISDKASVGIEGGGYWNDSSPQEGSSDIYSVFGSLTGKYYLTTFENVVAPYVMASITGDYSRDRRAYDNGGGYKYDIYGYSGAVGVGAEWFPIRRISIAGHVGVSGGFRRYDQEAGSNSANYREDGAYVDTFNSGIRLFFHY